MMSRLLAIALIVAIFTGGGEAAIIIELKEGADSVVMTVSGSFDLNATGGLRGVRPRIILGFLQPSIGAIGVGPPQQIVPYITNLTSWTPFGAGLFTTGAIGSGDRLDLYNLYDEPILGLPTGYISGAPIFGLAEIPGNFLSLGITPGTYVSTLDSGTATDTVTINAIPEPTCCAILSIALLTALASQRNRTKHG